MADLETLAVAVDGLNTRLDTVIAAAGELRTYGERSRTLIWRQWIPIVGVILLALALGWVAVGARHTAQVAKQAAATAQLNAAHAVSQCEASNNARVVTLGTWNTVLSADFTSNLPPAQQEVAKARLAGLRANLATVLAPQDCSKLK